MDKTIACVLGVVGAVASAAPGQAAPLPPSAAVLHASSYSELLRPVPNALETLRAMDQAVPEGQVELAQLGPIVRDLTRGPRYHHHHHHHHHRYERRRYEHHHHRYYDRRY